jgi:hypothetical protein
MQNDCNKLDAKRLRSDRLHEYRAVIVTIIIFDYHGDGAVGGIPRERMEKMKGDVREDVRRYMRKRR